MTDRSDELPEGIEDGTPKSYGGSVVHAKCTDPDCGREVGIPADFPQDGGFCKGTDEYNEGRRTNGHLTTFEVVGDE